MEIVNSMDYPHLARLQMRLAIQATEKNKKRIENDVIEEFGIDYDEE